MIKVYSWSPPQARKFASCCRGVVFGWATGLTMAWTGLTTGTKYTGFLDFIAIK